MKAKEGLLLFSLAVLLSACATPQGPHVMVWPGAGKPFEVFQSDDNVCRQWAAQQVGTSPAHEANKNLGAGAVIGTLVGAGLGAAIGAAAGNPALGAAIGAGSGLLGGTAVATGPAYGAAYHVQRQYDNAYAQCMFMKGNQIPRPAYPSRRVVPPPPGYPPPPPPPGYPQYAPPPPSSGAPMPPPPS